MPYEDLLRKIYGKCLYHTISATILPNPFLSSYVFLITAEASSEGSEGLKGK
jgi:hypothetical protein